MKYRAEIDGLRAVAVVPVILFHAGFDFFTGGFVGVDVFFVISGYLITTILVEDLDNNRFSIVNFYERRARRILPALLFVTMCCIPFAWIWMLPNQMKSFFDSLIAVSLFGSNFLFMSEAGYFATEAANKPLLHTWSLAVEEQFYLLTPLVLYCFWQFGKSRSFWFIVSLAAFSFVFSEWGARNFAAGNFFLTPSRIWELLAGSIAAFIVIKRGVVKNDLLALLGLAAIVIAIFAYDENIPFPSAYGLLPVLGAMCLILFAQSDSLIAKFLSMKAFVWVGLMSYSAYLWHQPLFAFARIVMIEKPSSIIMLALCASTFVLAYFSWRFIEKPFRDSTRFNRRQIFTYSATALTLPLLIGIVGMVNNGFPKVKPVQSQLSTSPMTDIDREIWVLGDSHAAHLISGLEKITNKPVRKRASPACIPFRNVDRYTFVLKQGECLTRMNGYLDEVIRKDPDATIVLSSMGRVYLDGTTFNGKGLNRVRGLTIKLTTQPNLKDPWLIYELGMRETLKELSALKNVDVVFALDVPELGIDLGCDTTGKVIVTPWFEITDMVGSLYKDMASKCVVERAKYDRRTERYHHLVHTILRDFPRVKVFDPVNAFCDQSICRGYKEGYGFLYHDYDHLNENGSTLYAQAFASWFTSSHQN